MDIEEAVGPKLRYCVFCRCCCGPKVRVFPFQNKWIFMAQQFAGMERSWRPTESHFVCTDHFDPKYLKTTPKGSLILTKWAKPSKLLNGYAEDEEDHIETENVRRSERNKLKTQKVSEHEVVIEPPQYLTLQFVNQCYVCEDEMTCEKDLSDKSPYSSSSLHDVLGR